MGFLDGLWANHRELSTNGKVEMNRFVMTDRQCHNAETVESLEQDGAPFLEPFLRQPPHLSPDGHVKEGPFF